MKVVSTICCGPITGQSSLSSLINYYVCFQRDYLHDKGGTLKYSERYMNVGFNYLIASWSICSSQEEASRPFSPCSVSLDLPLPSHGKTTQILAPNLGWMLRVALHWYVRGHWKNFIYVLFAVRDLEVS